MYIDPIRLARQEICVDKWFSANCDGILDIHPGVGKTFIASLAIKRLEKEVKSTYVVVVPSSELEIQWKRKIIEFFPQYLIDRVVIKTMHTVISEGLNYDVETLIIDEIHEFTTEERLKIIDGTIIKFKRFLGLTGSGDDKNFKFITRHHKIIDYISGEEAIEKGYISASIEYNLALDLTLVEKELYDNFTNTINKNLPKFENNLTYAQFVLSGGKHSTGVYYSGAGWAWGLAVKKGWHKNLDLSRESDKTIDSMWNPNLFIGYAKNLINAIRGRKHLLCTATAKYNTILEILNRFNKIKTILFSESTDFADKIALILNKNNHPTVVYHSKLKTIMCTSSKSGKFIKMGKVRLKKEALDKIRDGRARVLSVTKSVDKGLDIPDLRMGITSSGTQGTTQYKQRSGRPTRREDDPTYDLPVLLINLYIKDTQDEKWLVTRQENNTHKVIDITQVSQIDYTPPSNHEFNILDL